MCFLKVQEIESVPKVVPEEQTGRRPPGVQRRRVGGHPVWGEAGCGAGVLRSNHTLRARRPLGPLAGNRGEGCSPEEDG